MAEKIRVLVVDDDPSMVKTLVDIFRFKGLDAEAAYSAAEALQKVSESDFDFVLSDVKMPAVSGVELYRAIRLKRPHLPVVLMTAYSTDKLVKEGLEEDNVSYVTKPLDINALLSFFRKSGGGILVCQ